MAPFDGQTLICELPLRSRIRKCLSLAGVITVQDAREQDDAFYWSLPFMGGTSIKEVRDLVGYDENSPVCAAPSL